MLNVDREDVVKSVILVLLGEDLGSSRSLADELQKAVDNETIRVATGREQIKVSYAAVEIILDKMNPSQTTVDFAVEKCLEIYGRNKNNLLGFGVDQPLTAAIQFISFGASTDVIEKVIGAVAEKGWYGRIEALTKKYLDRGLNPREVMALVDKYVNDKGARGEHSEKELLRIAQLYAPEVLDEVECKIEKFIKDFEADDGLY